MDFTSFLKITALLFTAGGIFVTVAPYTVFLARFYCNVSNFETFGFGVTFVFFSWLMFKLVCYGLAWISSDDPGGRKLVLRREVTGIERCDIKTWQKTGARPKARKSLDEQNDHQRYRYLDWSSVQIPHVVAVAARRKRREYDMSLAIDSICWVFSSWMSDKAIPYSRAGLTKKTEKSNSPPHDLPKAAEDFHTNVCKLKGPVDWPSLPSPPSKTIQGLKQGLVLGALEQFARLTTLPRLLTLALGVTLDGKLPNHLPPVETHSDQSMSNLKTPVPPTGELYEAPDTIQECKSRIGKSQYESQPFSANSSQDSRNLAIIRDNVSLTDKNDNPTTSPGVGEAIYEVDIGRIVNNAVDLMPVEEDREVAQRRREQIKQRKGRWFNFRGKRLNLTKDKLAFSVGLVALAGFSGYCLYRLMKK